MTRTNHSTKPNTNAATALWQIAMSELQAALAHYNLVDAEHTAAGKAYRAEVGEADPDFAKYGLLWGPNYAGKARQDHIFHVAMLIAANEYAGQSLTADDYAAIMARAARLIDDSNAYKLKDREASARHLDKAQGAFDVACDKVAEARDKLFATPAPDAEALFDKLDLLNVYLEECDSEEKQRVQAISADIRSLLGA